MSGSLLEALVEEELGSVIFVMDYVQLDFGAARFSAYVWPTVTIGDASLHFGDRGYRDALCAFITHEVVSTDESPEVGLVIRFGLGEIVTNPPTNRPGRPRDRTAAGAPSLVSRRGLGGLAAW